MENKVENQMLEMMKQMTDRMENMDKQMEKGFTTVNNQLGEIDASIKYHTEILGSVAETLETVATNLHIK